MGTETELSETDENKPLIGCSPQAPSSPKNKEFVMATVSNASTRSGSDVDDLYACVDKCCSHMDDDYKLMFVKALKYIDVNPPSLISDGSSGSYFIHDDKNEVLGVFKPEDEEPYGSNNPKWGKWLQKVLLPCTFGRGCLVPNQGYVSEAAAYIVDQHFKINIVPPTAVVELASRVFNYGRLQRYEARTKHRIVSRSPNLENRFNWSKAYKKKKGSFQTFLHGYMDPEEFNLLYPIETLTEAEKHNLTVEFQKMFVLDYMIRNTDRLNANYLIKVEDPSAKLVVPENRQEVKEVIIEIVPRPNSSSPDADNQLVIKTESGESFSPKQASPVSDAQFPSNVQSIPETAGLVENAVQEETPSSSGKVDRVFKLACIDNGLAFPFKHPSDIRSYPFAWSRYFPYFANQPFVQEVKDIVLPILQNLHSVNQADSRYRKQETIKSQLSVFRGQMYNLLKAVENNITPSHLETKQPYYAKEIKKKKKRRSRNRRSGQAGEAVNIELSSNSDSGDSTGPQSATIGLWRSNYSIKKHATNPYFSCF